MLEFCYEAIVDETAIPLCLPLDYFVDIAAAYDYVAAVVFPRCL